MQIDFASQLQISYLSSFWIWCLIRFKTGRQFYVTTGGLPRG